MPPPSLTSEDMGGRLASCPHCGGYAHCTSRRSGPPSPPCSAQKRIALLERCCKEYRMMEVQCARIAACPRALHSGPGL